MPTFHYKGTSGSGTSVTETVEAVDRYGVYDHARGLGHTIVSLTEDAKGFSLGRFFNMSQLSGFLHHVKQDDIVMLSRNLGAMLRAGLALTRALSVCERQSKRVALKNTLMSVRQEIEKGKSFHEALELYPNIFSKLFVAMVRTGEEGGTLSEVLDTISLQMEQTSNLRKKIRGAMMYPTIVLIAMFGIGILMMIFVVPTLTQTFRELKVTLPFSTRIILGLSDFLSTHTLVALGLIAVVATSAVGFYRWRTGRIVVEWTLLRLPIIGNLVKETNAARTARTLSSLLHSGVDVVHALLITEDVVQNTFYKRILAEAAVHVEKGKPMSEDFMRNERLYPVLVGEMLAVGEETGQIAQMLEEVAKFYEAEVERQTKDLSTIIEPILMLFIGAAVGFFALAMISPIYSISDSIS